MKTKFLLTGALIALLSLAATQNADAQWHRGHRGGGWYQPRVFVQVPAPRPVVVVQPGYGYGYNNGYAYRPHRRWNDRCDGRRYEYRNYNYGPRGYCR